MAAAQMRMSPMSANAAVFQPQYHGRAAASESLDAWLSHAAAVALANPFVSQSLPQMVLPNVHLRTRPVQGSGQQPKGGGARERSPPTSRSMAPSA